MQTETTYDCGIIGGGIAGLSLSILLAQKGHKVILFEKNDYPFHKVCGEYVSNESRDFFMRLGLPLDSWQLPRISKLGISSEKGFMLNADLDLGGFGISRYKIDQALCGLAIQAGVRVAQKCRVTNVSDQSISTTQGQYQVKLAVGSFGKVSPVFSNYEPSRGPNYIGVKYHIKADFPDNRIELHNFSGGYCGISKVEDERYCLCYLTLAENLKNSGNSIKNMEENILFKNPFLKTIFTSSNFLTETPVTVSNIKFGMRKLYDGQLVYAGDAAGCISPLTGNGMSMAAWSANELADYADAYLKGKLSHDALKTQYALGWQKQFSARLQRGRLLQKILSQKTLSHFVLRSLGLSGALTRQVIRSTHGEAF